MQNLLYVPMYTANKSPKTRLDTYAKHNLVYQDINIKIQQRIGDFLLNF